MPWVTATNGIVQNTIPRWFGDNCTSSSPKGAGFLCLGKLVYNLFCCALADGTADCGRFDREKRMISG